MFQVLFFSCLSCLSSLKIIILQRRVSIRAPRPIAPPNHSNKTLKAISLSLQRRLRDKYASANLKTKIEKSALHLLIHVEIIVCVCGSLEEAAYKQREMVGDARLLKYFTAPHRGA